MSDKIEWGAVIKVNGKRPDFVRDDDIVAIKDGGSWLGLGLGWVPKAKSWKWHEGVSAILLPSDHPHYANAAQEDLPPDWAIERALEAPNKTLIAKGNALWFVEEIKRNRDIGYAASVLSHARYIAAHEEPPVDPDLEIAREAAAQVSDEDGCPDLAKRFRDGEFADCDSIKIALRAIKLMRERGV